MRPSTPRFISSAVSRLSLIHILDKADKQQLSTLLQSGRSNREIAYWLSRAYPREIETLDLAVSYTHLK